MFDKNILLEEIKNSNNFDDIIDFLKNRRREVYFLYNEFMNKNYFGFHKRCEEDEFFKNYPFDKLTFNTMRYGTKLHHFRRKNEHRGWWGNLISGKVSHIDFDISHFLENIGLYTSSGGWAGIWYYQFYIFENDFPKFKKVVINNKIRNLPIPCWI